jgi:hypothetical protein
VDKIFIVTQIVKVGKIKIMFVFGNVTQIPSGLEEVWSSRGGDIPNS